MNNTNKPSQQSPKGSVNFAVVESYKMIRTNLLFLLSQSENKIITVSSSLAGEGKSTSAINIAVAFSQLGCRVLLIDGDMRKPSVHKKLRLSNEKGLSSLLVGFCELSEAVTTVNETLDVITAGTTPPNPSELLGSAQMELLLSKLCATYDYIILDTPPVNIVPDALVIAPKTAGLVFVVQDYITPHAQLEKAIKNVKFAGARMLGVVLNGSNSKEARKYRYHNYNYYSYGNK